MKGMLLIMESLINVVPTLSKWRLLPITVIWSCVLVCTMICGRKTKGSFSGKAKSSAVIWGKSNHLTRSTLVVYKVFERVIKCAVKQVCNLIRNLLKIVRNVQELRSKKQKWENTATHKIWHVTKKSKGNVKIAGRRPQGITFRIVRCASLCVVADIKTANSTILSACCIWLLLKSEYVSFLLRVAGCC